MSICENTRDKKGHEKVAKGLMIERRAERTLRSVRGSGRNLLWTLSNAKARRHDRVTTPPRMQERAKEASSLEDSLTVVCNRKTPVVMTTQEYVGRSHLSLPIRSLSDPGTANKQMVKWASEDPTRLPGVQENVTK